MGAWDRHSRHSHARSDIATRHVLLCCPLLPDNIGRWVPAGKYMVFCFPLNAVYNHLRRAVPGFSKVQKAIIGLWLGSNLVFNADWFSDITGRIIVFAMIFLLILAPLACLLIPYPWSIQWRLIIQAESWNPLVEWLKSRKSPFSTSLLSSCRPRRVWIKTPRPLICHLLLAVACYWHGRNRRDTGRMLRTNERRKIYNSTLFFFTLKLNR